MFRSRIVYRIPDLAAPHSQLPPLGLHAVRRGGGGVGGTAGAAVRHVEGVAGRSRPAPLPARVLARRRRPRGEGADWLPSAASKSTPAAAARWWRGQRRRLVWQRRVCAAARLRILYTMRERKINELNM